MNRSIDSLKQRKIQLYHLQAGLEPVSITVEMPTARELKVGVSIGLSGSQAFDSGEVDVVVLGRGHFNATAFPREGALPELKTRGGRAAVATFQFEAVEKVSRPTGVELRLHRRSYQVPFGKSAGSRRADNGIPTSVAKLLPTSWPRKPK